LEKARDKEKRLELDLTKPLPKFRSLDSKNSKWRFNSRRPIRLMLSLEKSSRKQMKRSLS
jgi:hypothetical protein